MISFHMSFHDIDYKLSIKDRKILFYHPWTYIFSIEVIRYYFLALFKSFSSLRDNNVS